MDNHSKFVTKVEEDLKCAVCLETYTDPKQLQCHHVFCRKCLGKKVERDQQNQLILTCPTCRRVTPIPAGGIADIQVAFHANRLLDLLKEHKKAIGDACYCTHHPTRELDSFCVTCDKLICLECALDHINHEFNLVSKLFERYRNKTQSLLNPVEDHLISTCKSLNELNTLYGEIFDQQGSLEIRICEHARQIQQAAEVRKNELINRLRHITGEKLRDLASQRVKMEDTIAHLRSYLDTVHESLHAGSQKEVMTMSTIVGQQAKELTQAFQPDLLLKLKTEADLVFTAKPAVILLCGNFGAVFTPGLPQPEQCSATGSGLEEATVGETSFGILETFDYMKEPCTAVAPLIEALLISELTGKQTGVDVNCIGQGQYQISYQPTTRGRHQLHIKVSHQHIRGSPFAVAVRQPVETLQVPILTFKADTPSGIAVSNTGLLVIESKTSQVAVFSPKGERLESFGGRGSDLGQFKSPRGVAVNCGMVLVADRNNHRIQKFTAEGQFLETVGTQGDAALQFQQPWGVAFSTKNKKVYITDENHRIQVLSLELNSLKTFGRHGTGRGQFNTPRGIACDSTGKVYVSDTDNNRIQVLNSEGRCLRTFGNVGGPKERVYQPHGLAVDKSNGVVYVSQPYKHCISIFTLEGVFVTSFSTLAEDEEPGEFGPASIALDCDGLLYVCDFESDLVKIF